MTQRFIFPSLRYRNYLGSQNCARQIGQFKLVLYHRKTLFLNPNWKLGIKVLLLVTLVFKVPLVTPWMLYVSFPLSIV